LATFAIVGSADIFAATAPAATKLMKSLRFNVVLSPVVSDEHQRHKASHLLRRRVSLSNLSRSSGSMILADQTRPICPEPWFTN
jgi:hypothetical protein